eukprot:136722-Pelagomonas_calceolata.AAC.4
MSASLPVSPAQHYNKSNATFAQLCLLNLTTFGKEVHPPRFRMRHLQADCALACIGPIHHRHAACP